MFTSSFPFPSSLFLPPPSLIHLLIIIRPSLPSPSLLPLSLLLSLPLTPLPLPSYLLSSLPSLSPSLLSSSLSLSFYLPHPSSLTPSFSLTHSPYLLFLSPLPSSLPSLHPSCLPSLYSKDGRLSRKEAFETFLSSNMAHYDELYPSKCMVLIITNDIQPDIQ